MLLLLLLTNGEQENSEAFGINRNDNLTEALKWIDKLDWKKEDDDSAKDWALKWDKSTVRSAVSRARDSFRWLFLPKYIYIKSMARVATPTSNKSFFSLTSVLHLVEHAGYYP